QSSNSTGDTQLKLDILSDEIIENRLKKLSNIKAIISEEKESILEISSNADYIIAYDPLDGSSLVDVNFAVGSIFGIYKGSLDARSLVGAIYVVYGPRLEMVVCDDSVRLFRLNRDNEFKFIKNLELKDRGKINATGGTQKGWSDSHRAMIKSLFDDGYRLRYSGAMVSDLHQVLLKGGGLFSYPATLDAPNGKLRVAFEVLPFAYIYEKAGGATTDGVNDSLLDIKIEKTHQTTPCYFGSKFEIDRVKNG
ncbi:class 1 fructose-bisphosphatase, partial [Campylobacter lanienae]|uniref:class 1 fructose-bisphosphatase n=1 Tax=Campylobacter lanienae TaxID=75658 RepID=UPI00242FAB3A